MEGKEGLMYKTGELYLNNIYYLSSQLPKSILLYNQSTCTCIFLCFHSVFHCDRVVAGHVVNYKYLNFSNIFCVHSVDKLISDSYWINQTTRTQY